MTNNQAGNMIATTTTLETTEALDEKLREVIALYQSFFPSAEEPAITIREDYIKLSFNAPWSNRIWLIFHAPECGELGHKMPEGTLKLTTLAIEGELEKAAFLHMGWGGWKNNIPPHAEEMEQFREHVEKLFEHLNVSYKVLVDLARKAKG